MRFSFRASLLVIALAFAAGPLIAGNTVFLTDRNGQITFPISPPNRANSTPGAIDNMTIGATTPQPATVSTLTVNTSITNKGTSTTTQGAPTAATVSATLTAAALQSGIITVTQGSGANSAQQLPLATAMDTAFPSSVAGLSFDFSVINLGAASETSSITTNTGWTLVGAMTQAVGASSRFRARKTGTGTWVLYRLS